MSYQTVNIFITTTNFPTNHGLSWKRFIQVCIGFCHGWGRIECVSRLTERCWLETFCCWWVWCTRCWWHGLHGIIFDYVTLMHYCRAIVQSSLVVNITSIIHYFLTSIYIKSCPIHTISATAIYVSTHI